MMLSKVYATGKAAYDVDAVGGEDNHFDVLAYTQAWMHDWNTFPCWAKREVLESFRAIQKNVLVGENDKIGDCRDAGNVDGDAAVVVDSNLQSIQVYEVEYIV